MLKVFVYNNGKDKDKWTVINWKTKRVIGEFDELLVYNCERTTYKKNKGFVGICLPSTPDTLYHYKLTLQNGKHILDSIPTYSRIYFNQSKYPKGIRRTFWNYNTNSETYVEYTKGQLKALCDVDVWQVPNYYEDEDDNSYA